MENSKATGMLGLCKKAGRLIVGTDLTVKAIREKKGVYLVLLASDASDNTVKRATDCCTHYGVTCRTLPVTTEELGRLVGKGSAVAAAGVSDREFASAILARL